LSACVNDTNTKKSDTPNSVTPEKGQANSRSRINIYSTGDHKYISLDTTKFILPDESNISAANIFNGIYEFREDSLIRHSFLITKNQAFITTSEDLGQGIRAYLYVFNLSDKSLITDTEFKRNYLYSSAGIFVIDPDSNRIFGVDKEAWYELKQSGIIPASLYTVHGKYFRNVKNVYMLGGEIPIDTSLVTFYKNSISNVSGRVSLLPDDWWKTERN
jgi:hypothetical protein